MNIEQQLATLRRLEPAELRAKYTEVFGEPTRCRNKTWLIKRIAWRIQALAEGDLSERALARAVKLANDADLRLSPPRNADSTLTIVKLGDRRLPPPGTVITRSYKGDTVQVRVLSDGFEHEGQVHKTLSAVAKSITGSHVNGYQFFRLGGRQ